MFEIEILRTGTHTASNGHTLTLNQSDLQEIVNTYDPALFRAPLIVSHNTGNFQDRDIVESELAFGTPKFLKRVGDRVKAVFEKIAPQFVEWVRNGSLMNVSSSLYLRESASNPTPGKFHLRHIAALGANPPAIKGLAPLEMHEFPTPVSGSLALEFSEPEFGWFNPTPGSLFRSLRDWLIEFKGLITADLVLPGEAIEALITTEGNTYIDRETYSNDMRGIHEQLEALSAKCEQIYSYSETSRGKDMKKTKLASFMDSKKMDKAEMLKSTNLPEADFMGYMDGSKKMDKKAAAMFADAMGMKPDELMDDEEADMNEMAELRKQVSDLSEMLKVERAQRLQREKEFEAKEVTDFVEKLITQGKIIAADRDIKIKQLLATPNTDKIEFSEGVSKTLREQLMEDLSNRPPLVEFGQLFPAGEAPANFGEFDIVLPPGYTMDPSSAETYRKAKTYEKRHSVSFEEAVNAVMNGRN